VRLWILLLIASLAGAEETRLGRKRSTLDRMSIEHLAAATADVGRLAAERKVVAPIEGLFDFKGVFHAHAEDSAHTGGTRAEMLAEAQRAGINFVFFGSHYRPPVDFINDSWRGLKNGVLFIPGSEMHGFLLHPMNSVMRQMDGPKDELLKAVTAGEGMAFLSHVEERKDHPMTQLTGMEIYNRHYDAMDDAASLVGLAEMMTNPAGLVKLQTALRLYPDAMLASQLDYPALYLEKWDREGAARRVVGVAANDCHHNQEFVLKAVEGGVRLGTIVDKDSEMRLIKENRPGVKELLRGRVPGETIARLDFDPYFRSFFNVSTHALAPELTEPAIRKAVAAGHVYVAHDWMGDPKGFLWQAFSGEQRVALMGDEMPFKSGVQLTADTPLPARLRVMKNGVEWKSGQGTRFATEADGPGVYRVEAWLTIDGEERVWLYSNPIYLR
jgi:hypothetical protein